MNLTPYFKSIIDQDVASVVICNLKHEIIYMNPKAVESYHKWGGEALLLIIADQSSILITQGHHIYVLRLFLIIKSMDPVVLLIFFKPGNHFFNYFL